MTSVAIMQPTTLPYLGYFELIKEADIFVFLDNVKFSRGSYHQRNKVQINGKDKWLTIPVTHNEGQLLQDTMVASEEGIRKILYAIDKNFGLQLKSEIGGRLIDKTIPWIWQLCEKMDIPIDFRMASTLGTKDIVDICKLLGADIYISTAGSKAYLTPDSEYAKRFKEAGIDVQFREFKPSYSAVQYFKNGKYTGR